MYESVHVHETITVYNNILKNHTFDSHFCPNLEHICQMIYSFLNAALHTLVITPRTLLSALAPLPLCVCPYVTPVIFHVIDAH